MDPTDLSDAQLDQLANQLAGRLPTGTHGDRVVLSRRQALAVASGTVSFGALLGLGSDSALAQASADTSDGTVRGNGGGTDVYIDQLRDPGGDEVLNVDDTGAINAQPRPWVFDSVSTDILNTNWVTDAAYFDTLQAAVDAAAGSTGLVVAPPSTHTISSTLEIPDGVVLSGLTSTRNSPEQFRIEGAAGVDPVVSNADLDGLGVGLQYTVVVPDSTENAWAGDLEAGWLSKNRFAGNVVINAGSNGSPNGRVIENEMLGNDILTDTGISTRFLIDQNLEVGTITSNNATEGTNT